MAQQQPTRSAPGNKQQSDSEKSRQNVAPTDRTDKVSQNQSDRSSRMIDQSERGSTRNADLEDEE